MSERSARAEHWPCTCNADRISGFIQVAAEKSETKEGLNSDSLSNVETIGIIFVRLSVIGEAKRTSQAKYLAVIRS